MSFAFAHCNRAFSEETKAPKAQGCLFRAPGSTREKKPEGFSQPETQQCLLQFLQAELVLHSSALLLSFLSISAI